MNMDYLGYQAKPTARKEKAEIETENKTDKRAQTPTKSEVIAKHNAERKAMKEEIEVLPKDSQERMEKERAYKNQKAIESLNFGTHKSENRKISRSE